MIMIERDEVLMRGRYEQIREHYLAAMIHLKRKLRVRMGRFATLVFECKETLLFQIHEVLRVEGWTAERVVREIDEYQDLVPGVGSITATLLIDGGDPEIGSAIARSMASARGPLSLSLLGRTMRADVIAEPPALACPVHYVQFLVGANAANQLRSAGDCTRLSLKCGDLIAVADVPEATCLEIAQQLDGGGNRLSILSTLAMLAESTTRNHRAQTCANERKVLYR